MPKNVCYQSVIQIQMEKYILTNIIISENKAPCGSYSITSDSFLDNKDIQSMKITENASSKHHEKHLHRSNRIKSRARTNLSASPAERAEVRHLPPIEGPPQRKVVSTYYAQPMHSSHPTVFQPHQSIKQSCDLGWEVRVPMRHQH